MSNTIHFQHPDTGHPMYLTLAQGGQVEVKLGDVEPGEYEQWAVGDVESDAAHMTELLRSVEITDLTIAFKALRQYFGVKS